MWRLWREKPQYIYSPEPSLRLAVTSRPSFFFRTICFSWRTLPSCHQCEAVKTLHWLTWRLPRTLGFLASLTISFTFVLVVVLLPCVSDLPASLLRLRVDITSPTWNWASNDRRTHVGWCSEYLCGHEVSVTFYLFFFTFFFSYVKKLHVILL